MDEAQKKAICTASGSCEIIAGPGSGKTSVLIEHILFLIHVEKIRPEQILVLTFSREAAVHLRRRFIKRTENRVFGVSFGTFHSVFYRILREYSGISYRLLDDPARDRLIGRIVEEFGPGQEIPLTEDELEKRLRKQSCLNDPAVKAYREYLRENNYVDFDGILTESLHFLSSQQEGAGKVRRRFRHILVDEFQDINPEQYRILQCISEGGSVYAVGDDDQTIYGFRGSDPSLMEQFMRDHPDAVRLFLENNYRCSRHIVSACSRMIAQNRQRIPKHFCARGSGTDKVSLLSFAAGEEERRYLLRTIAALDASARSSCAVICRTNRQVQQIRSLLDSAGIPVRAGKREEDPAQKRILKEILGDLRAYYDLAAGLHEGRVARHSLYRVMNRPQRFLFRSIMDCDEETPAQIVHAAAGRPAVLGDLLALFDDCETLRALPPEAFLRFLLDSMGYRDYLFRNSQNTGLLRSVLTVMEERARRYGNMQDFLEEAVSFSAGQTGEQELPGQRQDTAGQDKAGPSAGVTVLTMHACKGLEFDRVYLPDLNEGIIPSRRSITPEEIEEERRLLYVAMTRARSHLSLCYIRGTRENPRPPSRFLSVYSVNRFVQS